MAWSWRFSDECPAAIRDWVGRWDELASESGASVIKSNASRTVLRVHSADNATTAIVKKYHVRGFGERLKYAVCPSRAKEEWRALVRLRDGGVHVPAVFAIGEDRDGPILRGAGLILDCLADVVHINEWLAGESSAEPPGDSARAALLREVGSEVGRLHSVGARHSDLHAGNVLVQQRGGTDTDARPVLIDHHVCRFGSSAPPEPRRLRDLAKFFHSMTHAWSPDDALEFLRGYSSIERVWNDTQLPRVRSVLSAMAGRIEAKRLVSRTRRCWMNSTEFVRESLPGWRCYRRRSFPDELAKRMRESPIAFDEVLDEVTEQRPRARSGLVRGQVDGAEVTFFVKERRVRSVWRSFLYALTRSPLERAWEAARALDVRRIPTAQGEALFVEGALFPRRVILVTRYVEAATLKDELDRQSLDRSATHQPCGESSHLHAEIATLADTVRAFHDTGIYHKDLNPSNVLVERNGTGTRFLFVDLDSVEVSARLSERRRIKNLVQLASNPEGGLPREAQLRFLHRYDSGERSYWNREFLRTLERRVGDAIVATIGKLSRFEQQTRRRKLAEQEPKK